MTADSVQTIDNRLILEFLNRLARATRYVNESAFPKLECFEVNRDQLRTMGLMLGGR